MSTPICKCGHSSFEHGEYAYLPHPLAANAKLDKISTRCNAVIDTGGDGWERCDCLVYEQAEEEEDGDAVSEDG